MLFITLSGSLPNHLHATVPILPKPEPDFVVMIETYQGDDGYEAEDEYETLIPSRKGTDLEASSKLRVCSFFVTLLTFGLVTTYISSH